MATPIEKKDLDSFRKMILELVPDAKKIIRKALKPQRPRKDAEGNVIYRERIAPKSIDLARWVMDQYTKLVVPGDADIHELHIIDHATLAQMKRAQEIVREMNQHQRNRRTEIGNN